jgi:hypothetical protein
VSDAGAMARPRVAWSRHTKSAACPCTQYQQHRACEVESRQVACQRIPAKASTKRSDGGAELVPGEDPAEDRRRLFSAEGLNTPSVGARHASKSRALSRHKRRHPAILSPWLGHCPAQCRSRGA